MTSAQVAVLEDELRRLRAAFAEADARLHREAGEFALLYRVAPLGLCTLDCELRYVRVNEFLARLNGFPTAAHLGKTFREVVPDIAVGAEPLLRQVLEIGAPVLAAELRGRTAAQPDLQRYWSLHCWPLKDDAGKVYGLSVLVEEMTEHVRLKEALRRELEFRTLAENSTDVIVRYDRSLTRTYANPAIERILGWSPAAVLGKTHGELGVPPDTADKWNEHLRQAFATGEERTMEFWLPTAGGTRFLQSRLIPEINERGDVETLLGITRDLTSIKRIEEALRESEARFRQVVELVPDILYRAELPSHRPSFVSPAIERVLGFTPGEWQADAELWRRHLHEDDYARVMAEVDAASAQAERVVLHYRMWNKDRTMLHWLEDRIGFERDESGHAVAEFGAMTDVSERVRSDAALRQREQEFRALAERSLDIVARHDRDLRYVYVNPAVEGATGLAPAYYLHKSVRDLQFPADVESLWVRKLEDVLATGEDRRFTFQHAGPNGNPRFFDTRLVPEFGTDGRVEGIISVTREITRLHEVEERLRQTVKQLEAANAQLQAQSRTDSLTGLANRRHLFAYIQEEWRRETRHDLPISLIVADVDHFKAYNDHYGHLAGDECLRRVAESLRTQVHRPGDLLARYGGEEFVAVLPETPVKAACDIAEAMRRAVSALQIEHTHSPVAPVLTISLGVAALSPQGHRAEDLFMEADQALYRAKERGRNRSECAVQV